MRAAVLILLSVALTPVAFAQPVDWHGCFVEVTSIDRQDPPAQLVERRAELEAERDAAGLDDAAKAELDRRIERLEARIEKQVGLVVNGWGVRVDRHRERVDRSTFMIGLFLPRNQLPAEAISAFEPGTLFLHVDRRTVRELVTVGGRKHYRARRANDVEQPSWWSTSAATRAVPEVEPETSDDVDVDLVFQGAKDREGRNSYRFTMKMAMEETPPESTGLAIVMRLRFVTRRGDVIGPIVDVASFDHEGGTPFRMQRSFDVGTPEAIDLDPDATRLEILGVAVFCDADS